MTELQQVKQKPYLLLREERAAKLGVRAAGGIRYAVLADPERTRVFVVVLANEGSGNFSKEVVEMRYAEEALAGVADGAPFPSKTLASSFVGRSACNAGFMAALLRAEGLVAPAPDVKHKLVRSGDWGKWKADALAIDGKPFMYPPLPEGSAAAPVPSAARVDAVEPGKTKPRRNKRGGNRLVKVEMKGAESHEPAPDQQENSDEDPA